MVFTICALQKGIPLSLTFLKLLDSAPYYTSSSMYLRGGWFEGARAAEDSGCCDME